jgi:hypothetical protein
MKISRNYLILYSVVILLTSLFLLFILVVKNNYTYFPIWILTLGHVLFFGSILSFLRNLKSVQIKDNEIQISRLILPNIIIKKENIIEIRESQFYYRGDQNSHKVYEGYYLIISTEKKKYKTSSLNESNYSELRNTLKRVYGKRVILEKFYTGESINWFYIFIMLLPAGYLLVEIIKRIK